MGFRTHKNHIALSLWRKVFKGTVGVYKYSGLFPTRHLKIHQQYADYGDDIVQIVVFFVPTEWLSKKNNEKNTNRIGNGFPGLEPGNLHSTV
jgi:hypothetical protein